MMQTAAALAPARAPSQDDVLLLDTTMDAQDLVGPEDDASNQSDNRSAHSEEGGAEEEAAAAADDATGAASDDDDDDFNFNAPSYYDLRNPGLEQRYVNNADGYFSSPAPSAVTSTASPFSADPAPAPGAKQHDEVPGNNAEELQRAFPPFPPFPSDNNDAEQMDETLPLDTTMAAVENEEEAGEATAEPSAPLSRSRLLEDRPETFEEVFRQYASSSQSSATSSYLLHELDTSMASSTSSPRSVRRTAPGSEATGGMASLQNGHAPAPRSAKARFAGGEHNNSITSKLMQPTQSYLRRLQAEQRLRQQSFQEDAPQAEDKPHRVTRPLSPKFHSTRPRHTDPKDVSRMSSTSRELLKIQEERLLLQMEKLKIREFHEKTKVTRPTANVHKRSTKQLTIPQSPHFEVDTRSRHSRASAGSADASSVGSESPRPPVAAERLLSRDYAYPKAVQAQDGPHGLTVPQSPHLETTARAASHSVAPPPAPSREWKKTPTPESSRLKPSSLTKPMTPQLQTSRRAASYRKPLEIVDHDAEELAKKFHARPISRGVLEQKTRASPVTSGSKSRLTQPLPPRSSSGLASTSRQSTAQQTIAVSSALERHRKERQDKRLRARQTAQSNQHQAVSRPPRRPVVPETPPLKSLQLHRQYQENFQRRVEQEEAEKERLRQFRANPMRVTSTPAKFEGSTKPLTEVQPFSLPGERYHEQARQRLEQRLREEEEQRKVAGTFKAKPMPVYEVDNQDSVAHGFQVKASDKPLTESEAPLLASDRRAAERAAFDAAERERREREDAYRKQKEAEARQLEEDEIKRLRREKMVFHARPVPERKSFQLKTDAKPLTEPQSPIAHFRAPRSGGSERE